MEKQLIPELRFPNFKDEWKIKKIENILSIGSGKNYKHLKDGVIPVYGTGGYMTSVDEFLYDGESVCIGRKGTIDKPIFLNEKFWTVDTLFYTHSFKQVLPRFVYSLFQNINWYKHNEASGVPSLSKKTIEKINLNIPELPEQQKIATFLTDVDDKITKLTKKKDLLEEYKKGIMQKIFNQELRFKDDNGNAFADWKEKKLGDIGTFRTSSVDKLSKQDEQEVHLVNYMNVYRHETISNHTVKSYQVVTANENQLKSSNLSKGDILFTPSSETPTDIGHSVVIFEDINDAVYSYHLIRFRPKIKLDLMFSHYFCNTSEVLRQLSRFSTGSTRFTISISNFSKVKVSYPCIEEQTKIANFLSDIDLQIDALNTIIENTQTFKKGLLQKMFV
jgi:type I restriction enzyme S subunit